MNLRALGERGGGLFDREFSLSGLRQAGYAEFGAWSLAEKILFLARSAY
jgi:hypothetical protein